MGALSNLGYCVLDGTIGNVPRRHGVAPAPKRSQNTTWKEFIASHMSVLAGIDFFTVDARLWRDQADQLAARSPNLNAFAERWVRSEKQECLSKLVLFGEASLRRALGEFVEHFHAERNHQGKGNILPFPSDAPTQSRPQRSVVCRERLGGLLKYYCRAA